MARRPGRRGRQSGKDKRPKPQDDKAGSGKNPARGLERVAGQGRLRDAIRILLARDASVREREIDRTCRKLFEQLREKCPGLLPPRPLPAGEPGPDIELDRKSASLLLAAAGRKISGNQKAVIWSRAGNELAVLVDSLAVATEPGFIHVRIPVRCDQTGSSRVTVTFAVGSQDRPAGMIAATNPRPKGPPRIVALWSEALVALAWGAVLEMVQAVAFEAGEDIDRAGLIPGALFAGGNGLRLRTMARHPIDRRPG